MFEFLLFVYVYFFSEAALLGSSASGTTQSSLFQCCPSLLPPPQLPAVFSLLESAIKVAFSSHRSRVFGGSGAPRTALLAGQWRGCTVGWWEGRGTKEGWGRLHFVTHRRLFYTRLQEGQKSMRKQQLAPLWAPFSAEQQLRGDH